MPYSSQAFSDCQLGAGFFVDRRILTGNGMQIAFLAPQQLNFFGLGSLYDLDWDGAGEVGKSHVTVSPLIKRPRAPPVVK